MTLKMILNNIKIQNFIHNNPEKQSFNQYWYSEHTIDTILKEIIYEGDQSDGYCVFLSTPSLFFSLEDNNIIKKCLLFDIDDTFNNKTNSFIKYDYNNPLDIPSYLYKQCSMIIIDPPFITKEVWEKYTETVQYLIKKDGKILLTTILENQSFIKELLNCEPQIFQPSIPNLVYQYSLYTNYKSTVLNETNNEIK